MKRARLVRARRGKGGHRALPALGKPQPEPEGRDRSSFRGKVSELSWADFDRWVKELALKVRKDFSPQAVVGVAHGGVFVGGALATTLGVDFFPVRISRRSRDQGVRKTPRIFGQMPKELKGKRVLIVDDVAASGDTLELARELASKVGARAVRTACLVCREEGYQPDWYQVRSGQLFVYPWDYATVVQDGRFDMDPDRAGA